ncbi:MAG: FAD:protein FMN transferase [Eubacteriales bacterium]|nr:FAD:protein FMN transferase [Eubacteriales bacterium]
MSIEEQSTTFNEFDNLITVVIHSIQGRGMQDADPLSDKDRKDIKVLLSECRGIANKVSRCLNTTINRAEMSSLMRRYEVNKPFKISPMLYEFLEYNLLVYDLSDGDYDFTVAPLTIAWREIDEKGLTDYGDMLSEALSRVGAQHVELLPETSSVILKLPNMRLDHGVSYRGYTLKYMKEHLIKNGVTSGYINMGGNLHMIGRKPDGSSWRTSLINQLDEGNTIGVVELEDEAIASATVDERGYVKGTRLYRHLINPYTGEKRETGLFSVTCVSDSPWVADITTTVLFLIGLERGEKFMKVLSEKTGAFLAYSAVNNKGEVFVSPKLEFVPVEEL